MKIAAALTSMDAARTYTEVNNVTFGLQTQQQATPLNLNPFNTRFRSLINSSSPSPSGPLHSLQQNQQQCTSCCSDTLMTLTGELVGRPVHLIATDANIQEPRENNPQRPLQATITSRLIHYEQEKVYFSANGSVTTEDGRDVSFSLDLSMQRTTMETLDVSIKGDRLTRYLVDPLVLSFTGDPPTFADTSFLFDLDCDGRQDNLAQLQPGCGFLAFDKNEDGRINNGLELFGPQSGNGFTDLSVFDEDSNLWIDENDPIFDSLSIWRPDDQGTDTLLSLKEAGVGAIALSHAGTQFTLQGADKVIIGQVAANGIFLTEKGEVRSLQEIDLAIGDTDHAPAGSEHEDTTGFLNDAMTSLRLIISMQRMRARLLVARHRLQEDIMPWLRETEPVPSFSPPGQQPDIVQESGQKHETIEALQNSRNQGQLSTADQWTKPALNKRKVQEQVHPDSIFRPLHSLNEMRGFAWANRLSRGKDLLSGL